jgi:hypothetical protein
MVGRSDMDFILVDDEEDKLLRLDNSPWVAVCESEARLGEEDNNALDLSCVGQWADEKMSRVK